MFYGIDTTMGMVADYNLDIPVKQKSINFYVQDVPMILAEAAMHNELIFALPVAMPYGVRTRVWSHFYPDAPFTGEMVSYVVYNDLGQAVETLIPYDTFDMKTVPWDDIIA